MEQLSLFLKKDRLFPISAGGKGGVFYMHERRVKGYRGVSKYYLAFRLPSSKHTIRSMI